MKDFLKNELNLNDDVVLMIPNYRGLVKGIIIAFTPKKVRVQYQNTWNFASPQTFVVLQEPSQIVKIQK